jgi:protein-disulfide isomerase
LEVEVILRSLSRRSLSLVPLLALFIAALSLTGTGAAKDSAQKSQHAATQPLPPPNKTFGSKDAPITFEVFSDYQCPSCRSLYENTLRPMMNDYVSAGKVYLVHRDFPLPMHPYSYMAARWATAAARIGKFGDVDSALYDNQTVWAADGNIEKFVAAAMSKPEFERVQKQMAGACSVNPNPNAASAAAKPASFHPPQTNSACPLDTYINQDVALGHQVPVQATPTFIIYYKGQKYPPASGAVAWPVMKQFFDSLMSQ